MNDILVVRNRTGWRNVFTADENVSRLGEVDYQFRRRD